MQRAISAEKQLRKRARASAHEWSTPGVWRGGEEGSSAARATPVPTPPPRTHRCIGFSDTRIGDSEPMDGVAAQLAGEGRALRAWRREGAPVCVAARVAAHSRGGGALAAAAAATVKPLRLGVDAIGEAGSARGGNRRRGERGRAGRQWRARGEQRAPGRGEGGAVGRRAQRHGAFPRARQLRRNRTGIVPAAAGCRHGTRRPARGGEQANGSGSPSAGRWPNGFSSESVSCGGDDAHETADTAAERKTRKKEYTQRNRPVMR